MFVAVCVNDGDKGPGQGGQKGWSGWGKRTAIIASVYHPMYLPTGELVRVVAGPHARVFGLTPSETGRVTLVDKGPDTSCSDSDAARLNSLNIKFNTGCSIFAY